MKDRFEGSLPGSKLTSVASLVEMLGLANAAGFELQGPLEEISTQWLVRSEQQHIATATDKRQREFATGRAAARLAAAELGMDLGGLPVGEKREPMWPDGVTGSITHTSNYVLSVVARISESTRAIGVDAEHVASLEPGVTRRILTPLELERIAPFQTAERDRQIIRIFSAKEAFYKAQFQITGLWVGFQDAETTPTDSGYALTCSEHEVTATIPWPQHVTVVDRETLAVSGISISGVPASD